MKFFTDIFTSGTYITKENPSNYSDFEFGEYIKNNAELILKFDLNEFSLMRMGIFAFYNQTATTVHFSLKIDIGSTTNDDALMACLKAFFLYNQTATIVHFTIHSTGYPAEHLKQILEKALTFSDCLPYCTLQVREGTHKENQEITNYHSINSISNIAAYLEFLKIMNIFLRNDETNLLPLELQYKIGHLIFFANPISIQIKPEKFIAQVNSKTITPPICVKSNWSNKLLSVDNYRPLADVINQLFPENKDYKVSSIRVNNAQEYWVNFNSLDAAVCFSRIFFMQYLPKEDYKKKLLGNLLVSVTCDHLVRLSIDYSSICLFHQDYTYNDILKIFDKRKNILETWIMKNSISPENQRLIVMPQSEIHPHKLAEYLIQDKNEWAHNNKEDKSRQIFIPLYIEKRWILVEMLFLKNNSLSHVTILDPLELTIFNNSYDGVPYEDLIRIKVEEVYPGIQKKLIYSPLSCSNLSIEEDTFYYLNGPISKNELAISGLLAIENVLLFIKRSYVTDIEKLKHIKAEAYLQKATSFPLLDVTQLRYLHWFSGGCEVYKNNQNTKLKDMNDKSNEKSEDDSNNCVLQ